MFRYLCLAWTLSALAMSTPALAESKPARAAYESKQFERCGALFLMAADEESGDTAASSIYNAACCQALAGQTNQAFATLERAEVEGFRDLELMVADSDLAALRTDARWEPLVSSLRARTERWEKSLGDPALRRELLALKKAAQDDWEPFAKSGFKDRAALARFGANGKKRTARLKEIVAARGWPDKRLVGADGVHAAWMLVTQACRDLAFQKSRLADMEEAVARGDADAEDWAEIVDRVALSERCKQVYGTHFRQNLELLPIEDEAHVDERRKAIGLPPLAEYQIEMRQRYGAKK